ncbi:hypothetical protein JCM8115_001809 [Rhodotorula mucilaginosa]|uniref:C-5 sterol desaturase n=1 Tax=Rhodotorula mucilaginosa TaxID=5537 RepID=A0A9P7B501_RHOMI|nr:c-5 sterol desaturase [Rhodotorula mucilaginosa]
MDIPLHYFDEYIGDRLYAALDNPFAHFAAESGSTATFKNVSSLAAAIDLSSTSAAVDSVTRLVGSVPGLSSLGRDSIVRQALSLYGITYVGIFLLYFSVATFSYYAIFDHRMEQHPRFLKNQVRKEIAFSLEAFPMLDLLTLPWFVGDVRGWSMLYDTIEEGPFGKQGGALPWLYMAFSAAFFLWFTDFCIYWVHRWLHIPFLYKRLHKPHHKWIIPTPFASHAFHPVDGYLQSVPYHMACYMFPIHKYMFIGLFSFVNLWSIFIHDSDMLCDHPLEHYINGPAHHTLHHLYFTCNYGQYFTWADKAFSSFRVPAKGDDPLVAVLAGLDQKKREQEKEQATAVVVPPEMKRIDSGLGSEVEPESPSSSSSSTASGHSSANSSDREQSVEEAAGKEGAQRRRRSTRASMAAAVVAPELDTSVTPTRPVRREGLRARK